MRREKISEIINNINSQYIEEAAVYTGEEKRQSPYVWLKWSAVATGIVLIIFLNMAILGRTHTVTLDNGDTIKFVKDKSAAADTEGKIEAISRSLTEEEIQQLFGDLPVKAHGLFDVENHQLFLLEGMIGDVKLCATTLDSLFDDTETMGYTDVSIINGIIVYGSYFYSGGKNRTIIYDAAFHIGNSTVHVECADEYKNAKEVRNQIAQVVYNLIENGEINLEQIVK